MSELSKAPTTEDEMGGSNTDRQYEHLPIEEQLAIERKRRKSAEHKLKTLPRGDSARADIAMRKVQYCRRKIGYLLSRMHPVYNAGRREPDKGPDGYLLDGMLPWSEVNDLVRVMVEDWPFTDDGTPIGTSHLRLFPEDCDG